MGNDTGYTPLFDSNEVARTTGYNEFDVVKESIFRYGNEVALRAYRMGIDEAGGFNNPSILSAYARLCEIITGDAYDPSVDYHDRAKQLRTEYQRLRDLGVEFSGQEQRDLINKLTEERDRLARREAELEAECERLRAETTPRFTRIAKTDDQTIHHIGGDTVRMDDGIPEEDSKYQVWWGETVQELNWGLLFDRIEAGTLHALDYDPDTDTYTVGRRIWPAEETEAIENQSPRFARKTFTRIAKTNDGTVCGISGYERKEGIKKPLIVWTPSGRLDRQWKILLDRIEPGTVHELDYDLDTEEYAVGRRIYPESEGSQ